MDIFKCLLKIDPDVCWSVNANSYNQITCEDPWTEIPSLQRLEEVWREIEKDGAKLSKLAEINQKAEQAYVAGFYSSATGDRLLYDSDVNTQSLLNSLYLLADAAPQKFSEKIFYPGVPAGYIPIRAWVTDPETNKTAKQTFLFDGPMVIELNNDLTSHIATVKQRIWDRQEQVELANTVDSIATISW